VLIVPNNWTDLQHYKDRSPPWIKLHKKLLDNYEFQSLPVASRALAPMLWLLASEHELGQIDAAPDKLAFRLRMTEAAARDALKPLIDKHFFSVVQGDSSVLAGPKRGATPETEAEAEERQRRDRQASDFEIFYAAYPKRRNRADAVKAFAKVKEPVERLVAAIKVQRASDDWQKEGGRFVPYPASWLNSEGWLNSAQVGATGDWHESRSGVEGKAQELGLGAWNEVAEQWPAYKARVMRAAMSAVDGRKAA
jgi:hypothetical protein